MKLAWPVLWVKLEFHHPQPAVPGARGQSPGRLRELCPGSVSAAGDEPGAVWPSEAPSGGQEISRGGGWSRLTHPCNGSLQGAAGASLAFTAGRGAVPLAGLAQVLSSEGSPWREGTERGQTFPTAAWHSDSSVPLRDH